MSDRIKKINSLLKQELNSLILSELEFPAGTLVTIMGVDTTKDLHYAKVYISVLPLEFAAQVKKILERSNIQKFLFKKLSTKFIPKLEFIIDATEAKAREIEGLLDKIKKSE